MESASVSQDASAVPKRALLIDPEPTLAGIVSRVLKPEEWMIFYVPDNVTALELAKHQSFSIVVTGVKTSGLADLELLSQIRRTHPHIRFIILADKTTPSDLLAAMRERAFSCLSKDYSSHLLAHIVWMATLEPAWDDGIELLSASPEWISVAARCEIRTAHRLLQFFREMSDLPEREKEEVAMAVRELLLNAMEHGGKFDPSEYVELDYIRTTRTVLCRIKDSGQGFSLDEIQHAAATDPVHHPIRHLKVREARGMRLGGYGVLLARHFADEVVYNENGTQVLLAKYLPGSPFHGAAEN